MAIRLTSTFNSRRATNTLYVMDIILKLLENGKRCTLRALYYKAAHMFKTQRECDTIIDDIACFLSCRRENLNIVAADKGEVIGNLSYIVEGDKVECFKRSQVIPHSKGLEATRRFLNILNVELKIPVFGLFDSDPFGFHIFSVYKCGSQNMSYDSASLTTPDMIWLGILPSDVNDYNIPEYCV
ncbi:DNA topoisomerase 6 subunit A [Trifolium repens]|nr:DNA topoisomerase 6 subunit A [Trifolium repens]